MASGSVVPVHTAGVTLLQNHHKILDRWANNFLVDHHLLHKLPELPLLLQLDTPPQFFKICLAIWSLKNNKAEVLKHGGYPLTPHLYLHITHFWKPEVIPQDWKDASIMVIYKQKGDRAICGNSCRISLCFISGKVLAKIDRLTEHISETALPESHCGSRKSRCNIDMIVVLRQLLEKRQEQLYTAFIDLSKAVDPIIHEALWKLLSKLDVTPKFLSILQNLQDGMQDGVVTECQSEPFKVDVGVKLCSDTGPTQSPPLSHDLSPPSCLGSQRWSSPGLPP